MALKLLTARNMNTMLSAFLLLTSSQATYFYSSSKVNIPIVPSAYQQVGKLTNNLDNVMKNNVVDDQEQIKDCEYHGLDWTTILITMIMTVLAFWFGQLGVSFATRCPGWVNHALIKVGLRKKPKKKRPRARKVAGKFCVFPLKKNNKQIIAHIREPMRSNYIKHNIELNQRYFQRPRTRVC